MPDTFYAELYCRKVDQPSIYLLHEKRAIEFVRATPAPPTKKTI